MAWFRYFASAALRSYPLRKLSPDGFERLVYWLTTRCGEFDAVHWYRGARASGRGRDVVAIKVAGTGRERWYIQCKRHRRISYAVLRRELDNLSDLAAKMPNFAPQVIVFTTTDDVPSLVRNKGAIYARARGLPEPRYWGRRQLNEMLDGQPETWDQFFGRKGPFLQQVGSYFAQYAGLWSAVILLGLVLYILARTAFSWRPPSRVSQDPTSVVALLASPMVTALPTPSPTPTPASTPTSTFTSTPKPSPTGTPQPQPTGTLAPTSIPASLPTVIATATPTPTPTPTTVLVQPALLEPAMGAVERAAVLRWRGQLGPGQYFVVRLRYLGGDRTWESGPLESTCWEAKLPADWYGGWRWQVQVIESATVLAESAEWDFWFDPFPRPGTPYPPIRLCGE